MGMKDINDIPPGRIWSELFTKAEFWPQVEMPTSRFDREGSEVHSWLKEATFDSYYSFGLHPKWDDYMTVAFEDENAAFAFKMRFGGN